VCIVLGDDGAHDFANANAAQDEITIITEREPGQIAQKLRAVI
jgi:hypothetical protein